MWIKNDRNYLDGVYLDSHLWSCISQGTDGYSTKDALMTSTNTAIGLSIRSFIIRNGSPDFKIRNKDTKKLERGATLHTASKDLQADHLFPRNSYDPTSNYAICFKNEYFKGILALKYTQI